MAICMLALQGCGGGGGGSLAPSSSSNLAINTLGYSGNFNASLMQSFQANQEYKNVSQYSASGSGSSVASSIHPYSLTNTDVAYGYGLSGTGVTIGVIDSGFANESDYTQDNAFLEMKTKRARLTFSGSITNPCSGGACNSHGTNVASIAAANFDNQGDQYFQANTGLSYNAYSGDSFPLLNHGMMGVAYNASLRIGDFNSFSGSLAGIAQLTNAMVGAKVLNNSWGLEVNLPSSIPADIGNYSSAEASNWLRANSGGFLSATDIANVYAAYKNFQNTGVVVFALQNTTSDTTPSLMAALPEIFTDLEGAWIAVGNIDTRGASRETMQVTRKSARCGATAPYCLVADGSELTGAGLYKNDGYIRGLSGTSFSAPQISGMIALLAEAFPSLSSEQLAARLLATAYNGFAGFSAAGSKTFGNGVVHQYSNEFGHGIPDMQAALNPIVSNSAPLGFVLNGTPATGTRVDVAKTKLVSGPAFGDAFDKALAGKTAAAYDALSGGFQFNLGYFLQQPKPEFALRPYSTPGDVNKMPSFVKYQTTIKGRPLRLGFNTSLSTMQDIDQATRLEDNELVTMTSPFSIGALDNGISQRPLDFVLQLNTRDSSELQAFAVSKKSFANSPDESLSDSTLLGLGYKRDFFKSDQAQLSLLAGYFQEYEAHKGIQSSGALELGESSNSFFMSPSFTFKKDKFSFRSGASLEYSLVDPSDGLIQLRSGVITSSFYSVGSWSDLVRERDQIYLRVWQPERVEKAKATVRLPHLVSSNSIVSFQELTLNLEPSSRTFNVAAGYAFPVQANEYVVSEVLWSGNPNHTASNSDQMIVRINWLYNF